MVEQDPGYGEQVITLPVVDRDVVAVDFGDAIGTAGIERSMLGLRRLTDLAEHLAAGCLVEADFGVYHTDGFQHPGDAEGRELSGQNRLRPTGRNEGHGREVIDFLRGGLLDRLDQRI